MKHVNNMILGLIATGTIYCCNNNVLNNILIPFGVKLGTFWSVAITVMVAVRVMLLVKKTEKGEGEGEERRIFNLMARIFYCMVLITIAAGVIYGSDILFSNILFTFGEKALGMFQRVAITVMLAVIIYRTLFTDKKEKQEN